MFDEKFENTDGMVNQESVQAIICQDNRELFNFTKKLENPSSLRSLIDQLEDAKCKINQYLTTLVEQETGGDIAEDQVSSDSECSLPEDSDVNPKRSKLVQ